MVPHFFMGYHKDLKLIKKNIYSGLCLNEPTIPIFSRDWWLDATVGDKNWDVALVEKGGRIVAAMPYTIHKSLGFTRIGQPLLTQTLGPWLAPLKGGHSTILSEQKDLMDLLIDQLPHFDIFTQCWHHSITNWLPFKWRGFNQTTRYTYIITLTNSYDPMAGFSSNMRNKVRKAEKLVEVQEDLPIEKFYDVNKKTFTRQGLDIPYSLSYVKRLDNALAQRGRRKIFFAADLKGSIHSTLYLMWDDQSSYVHLVGEDPELRNSGAGILLIQKAIQFSIEKDLSLFDFEGSMIEGVEIVRRSCGGIQTPYFQIAKTPSRLLRTRQCLVSLLRGR